MIETNSQLAELLPALAAVDRIAVDTEADSLHCYFEKLCLIQISVSGEDYLVDPLAQIDLAPLAQVLTGKEIVLQGADFDLRLLRRSFGFVATRIFDTVIAARLLGIRSFSLAALVEKFFGVTLVKGSQKANWARRPLPRHMAEYAMNDTHYLLPLAEKLEAGLRERGRLDWFRQSCERALEQAAVQRTRDDDEPWRISGSGKLGGRACAVLRELWHWRDKEAQASDRPAFHILQNDRLIRAAEEFVVGEVPDYRHFSSRRREAFREAGERGLRLSESEWPVRQRRRGTRPTREMERAAEELRRRRDAVADAHGLEPSLIAPRGALDAVAADGSRTESLLVPWQRDLLEL
ncbi:MAG: ribonuclease [Verrucomicrobiota bacterium]|jgi:ribonuclease D